MRGIHIFEKPYYREIRTMRGRPMRGLPVLDEHKPTLSSSLHNTKEAGHTYMKSYKDMTSIFKYSPS